MTVIEKDEQGKLIGIASEMTGELVRIVPFAEIDALPELAKEHESFREIFEASELRRDERNRHHDVEERRRAIIERNRLNQSANSKTDADNHVQPMPAWMKSKFEQRTQKSQNEGEKTISVDAGLKKILHLNHCIPIRTPLSS